MKFLTMIAMTLFLGGLSLSMAQSSFDPLRTADHQQQKKWVDSVYNSMSLEERLGQLFMVQAYSGKVTKPDARISELIRKNAIGGIIFSNGGPVSQAKLTNAYQAMARHKLLIAVDAEWGLSMRLDSTFSYPYNMMLGAVKDDEIIQNVGEQIGRHCKRLGVHINFAPDADINTNPSNPIIGNRSFGEQASWVSRKALAFMQGMQSAGVLANAKHFPGHGDTETDSHKTLPTVAFSRPRIEKVELKPFQEMINADLASVMVAHLQVPSLESRQGLPSSLSSKIVSGLLKGKLGFEGLIFTDAMQMKGVAEYGPAPEVNLAAFLAGNDIILMPDQIEETITLMQKAYASGELAASRLEESVKKILRAKYKVGLHHYTPVKVKDLEKDLFTLQDRITYERVVEGAITLIKNEDRLLPLTRLETKNIAYVQMGDGDGKEFLKALQGYAQVTEVEAESLSELLHQLGPYNTVIVGFHRSTENPWKPEGFSDQELTWLYELARAKRVILDVFVKPYALSGLKTLSNFESVLISYQNEPLIQQKSAEMIFGSLDIKGRLPVSIGDGIKAGTGLSTRAISRLGTAVPESVGLNSVKLNSIDSLVNRAIRSGVTPGAQVLVARRGKVVYNRSFGRHTYNKGDVVQDTNIYDLASLTKILATLPVLMKMSEDGKFDLHSTLGEMMPELRKTNKAELPMLRVLSHFAGFKAWIPFYTQTLDPVTKKPSEKYYQPVSDKRFGLEVADEMYLRTDYRDSIIKQIIDSELMDKSQYRYSDLPFYLLQRYIEKSYGKSLDQIVRDEFYKPMGMYYTGFRPLDRFRKGQVIPTEVDDYYRYQTVQGYVHDMGAAMMDGVAGHAGLFSNANDVAKIMQMYLQRGYYGGRNYFKGETLDQFNTCYFCDENNRRGLGFDKPQLGESGPTCGCVSMTSFGHTGFTGTYAWADPESEIIYVFLSNRTYPSSENRKLITEGTRTAIQEIIYDAIMY